ncbi:MAG TPA: PAS domain S-box protein [Bryobacteraceae bacterium]
MSDPGEARMIELGIRGVRVPLHAHIACLFENESEIAEAVGFLEVGLRGQDHCVFLGSADETRTVCALLEQHGFDVQALNSGGRLELLPAATGDLRLGAIVAAWERAMARGASLIRFMGFIGWQRRDWPDDYELLKVEASTAAAAERFPCIVLCMHDVGSTNGLLLRHGALEAHPYLICGSVTQENPYHIGPGAFSKNIEVVAAAISKRRKAEKALRDAERRYGEVLKSVKAILWRGDPSTFQFTFVSKQAEEILGYPAERWLTEAGFWADHIHSEDREPAIAFCQKTTQERRDHEFEYRMIAADGRVVWLHDSIRVVVEDGRPKELVGVMVDITAQKQAEMELRASEERFRSVFANAAIGVGIVDREGHVLEANRAYCEIIGYSLEELRATDLYSLTDPADLPESRRLLGKLLSGEVPSLVMEKRYVRKDGRSAWVRNSVSLLRYGDGKPIRLVTLMEDITRRKQIEEERGRLEEQLLQAQKLESIGRLAGGVAHDFNNLLTVIGGYTVLLRRQLPADQLSLESLDQIESACGRAEALTRQLLAFGRRQVLRTQVLDLNDTVGNAAGMLRQLIGENIGLQTVLSGRLGSVKADAGQIQQVVMNLVLNARDALQDGGTLALETENVELDEDYAQRHPGVVPGPHVMLAVRDSGIGMDKETLAHIFEPFFTTKEQGKGSGLGLSVVYGIVEQSGGHVTVESEKGLGTTVRIYLPRVEEPEETEAEPAAPFEPTRGTETILLVEDEDPVRGVIQTFLQKAGYTVIAARDGAEALALCETYPGTIHLMITDVVMPGMDGPTLAAQAGSIRSTMKVLYISGYAGDEVLRLRMLETRAAFLPKPFSAVAVCSKIREVLDSPQQAYRG